MDPRPLLALLVRGALLVSISLVGCSTPPDSSGAAAAAPAATAELDAGSDPVVAVVGSYEIHLSELEAAAAGELQDIDQRRYQVLLGALTNLLRQRSLDEEAASRGMSVEELIIAEVDEKLPAVTDEAIEGLMADPDFQAKVERRLANVEGDEAQQAVLEDARRVVRSRLEQEGRGVRIRAFLVELKAAHPVQISFRPPAGTRKEVPVGNSPVKGAADAVVTIVEFSDFECPFCGRAQGTLASLLELYPDEVRLAYKHMPLAMHANAPKAAEAAECAREQDGFWDYHDLLYTHQRELGVDQLVQYAVDLGLDGEALRDCVDSGRMSERVREDMALASKVGVSSTPMFFVNGLVVKGAQPLEAFQVLIEGELELAG